jgi:hypothetical protein
MSSFSIDARIVVKLECDLAVRVGECLLNSGTEDKQILALGHRLKNIDEEEEQMPTTRIPSRFNKMEYGKTEYGNSEFEKKYKQPLRAAYMQMQDTDQDR